jgi:hypothetical protein
VALSDREAADIRAGKASNEAHADVSNAVNSARGQHGISLHQALSAAVANLSRRLIEIYAQLPEADVERDQLVKAIKERTAAFIQSCHATYGRGDQAASVARLATNLSASLYSLDREFELAVHDNGKQNAREPRPEPRTKSRTMPMSDELARILGTFAVGGNPPHTYFNGSFGAQELVVSAGCPITRSVPGTG